MNQIVEIYTLYIIKYRKQGYYDITIKNAGNKISFVSDIFL